MTRSVYIIILFILCGCGKTVESEWLIIEGGSGTFGDQKGRENEGPVVEVKLNSFYMMSTEVTNSMFHAFVKSTGFVTDAEKSNVGLVFSDAWELIAGANWMHPSGPDSDIHDRWNHPVVQVSWNDALAYCNWVNGRLPTEIEWEHASKKGNSVTAKKNIWSGAFPIENDASDGYMFTAPVMAYDPDELGLRHMSGNVWEWCQDKYNYEVHDILLISDTHGQKAYLNHYFHPALPKDSIHVIKGGSFMCHKSYCSGYRPEARETALRNESSFHIGFRVVKDIE
jgi:formylglycine-generating enzyme required for sulfatase activity